MTGIAASRMPPTSPPLVYLDTQDYSRFGDVLRGKGDATHEHLYRELLNRRDAGDVLFVYSMAILGELLQFNEEHAETTECKARAIEQICTGNVLIYPGRLVALEVARALYPETADCSEPSAIAFSNSNYWYPNVADVFDGLKAQMQRQLMDEVGALGISGRALKRAIKANAKKLNLAKVAREAAPTVAQQYGLPPAAVTRSIVGVLEGRVSSEEASHALFGAIAHPTAFVDIYFRRYEGEKTLPLWISGVGSNLQRLLEELKAKLAPYIYNPQFRAFMETELQNRRRGLGATILALAASDLDEFGINPTDLEDLKRDPDRAAQVPACLIVGEVMSAYASQTTGIQGTGKIERSFGGDLVHALYLPHVSLWRGDRRFSHLVRSTLPNLCDGVVGRLVDLPQAIDKLNLSKGK
ncbi:MAG: hypothetical protein ACXWUO_12550 [Allosphingosinicella sp.]